MDKIAPHISIVGAGPGDPDLLTLKAIKTLKRADVVLYDALVSREILSYVPEHAVKVYVGKRAGKYVYSQDEINRLAVQYALYYGHVVRLKGGDPFVFGRGPEEIAYAESQGIGTSFVPGLSSSVAVPGLQGIPVTCRGVSESFWVVTGTTKSHQLSRDIAIAAQSSATLVILMGVHKVHEIAPLLQEAGRGACPVAVIQDGCSAAERVGISTVDRLQELVEQHQFASPAVIVVGEVVRQSAVLGDLLAQFEQHGIATTDSRIRLAV